MRILGLDVGDKRIGVSLSDPTHTLAQALELYHRVGPNKDVEAIGKIVAEHDVGEIVVGLPKDLSGAIGERARTVTEFAERIEQYTGVRVVLWDERFSSNEAHRIFEMAQVKTKKRKPFIDMMAAQIILQGYLDAQKNQ
jgi:putative holliday junction resolvase